MYRRTLLQSYLSQQLPEFALQTCGVVVEVVVMGRNAFDMLKISLLGTRPLAALADRTTSWHHQFSRSIVLQRQHDHPVVKRLNR